MADSQTFREACCEKLGISTEAFDETVLWQCLYPRGLLPGKWQWRFDRAYFDADIELIHAVGDCTNVSEMRGEIDNHRYHHRVSGLRRRILRMRVSSQRLTHFASKFIQ